MRLLLARRVNLLPLAAAIAWILLAGTAGAQGPKGTTLELRLPSEGAVGQEMAVEARLADVAGVALVDVEVVFQREVEFMNAEGALELGRVLTDEQGLARLSFVPRSEGEMLVTALFQGNSQYGPASVGDTVLIQTGPPLYVDEAGVRVPGINVSLLAAILGAVWSTYFVVMTLIWRIAREGTLPSLTSRGVPRGYPHE